MIHRISYLALGANLTSPVGPPAQTLRAAIGMLAAEGLRVTACSRFWSTPCHPPGAGPDYVNAAVALSTSLDPEVLLARLHAVEAALGRVRSARWGARVVDLDLIAHGRMVRPDPATQARWAGLPEADQRRRVPEELVLPHPRLAERAFVLVPLAEIAPDWRHPLTGLSAMAMLAALPRADRAGPVPLGLDAGLAFLRPMD